jgi:hypothetical protein
MCESGVDVPKLGVNHGCGNGRNILPLSHVLNPAQKVLRFVSLTRKYMGRAASTYSITMKSGPMS